MGGYTIAQMKIWKLLASFSAGYVQRTVHIQPVGMYTQEYAWVVGAGSELAGPSPRGRIRGCNVSELDTMQNGQMVKKYNVSDAQ